MSALSPAKATYTTQQYPLGVALSGGGARGFAHFGAITALEEAGMRPDILAGVSAGAVVAVMYAAGVRPADAVAMFADMSFRKFCDFRPVGGGFFKIDKFGAFISAAIGHQYRNIEDLLIPVSIGITDLEGACVKVIESGPIIPALLASCSIPVVFQPVEVDGHLCVDGGVVRNLPARNIRSRCTKLIGINCSPVTKGQVKPSMIDIGLRSYRLLSKANVTDDIAVCDLAVEISEISAYSTFNMKEINQLYIRGKASMKRAIERFISNKQSQD